jgi:hypothetical protein
LEDKVEKNNLKFPDKCIVIRTKQKTVAALQPFYGENAIYEAVRRCWRIKLDRARMAEYVLAVVNYGTLEFAVEAVFKPSEWHCITSEECKHTKAPVCTCIGKPLC